VVTLLPAGHTQNVRRRHLNSDSRSDQTSKDRSLPGWLFDVHSAFEASGSAAQFELVLAAMLTSLSDAGEPARPRVGQHNAGSLQAAVSGGP
jgi:hypothetical protein